MKCIINKKYQYIYLNIASKMFQQINFLSAFMSSTTMLSEPFTVRSNIVTILSSAIKKCHWSVPLHVTHVTKTTLILYHACNAYRFRCFVGYKILWILSKNEWQNFENIHFQTTQNIERVIFVYVIKCLIKIWKYFYKKIYIKRYL